MLLESKSPLRSQAAKHQAEELTLTGARLVLADETFEGTVHIKDGLISDVSAGRSSVPAAVDLEGGYLSPGLVDLHTDNVEKHALPRTGVIWNPLSAVAAHDAVVMAAGITTVFDSLSLGSMTRDSTKKSDRARIVPLIVDAIGTARDLGLLRADHFLHLRCEITDEDVVSAFEPHADNPLVKLVSVMDHAPGHRQSPQVDRFRAMQIRDYGWSEEDADRRVAEWIEASRTIGPRNQASIIALARARQLPIASHDDETPDHVRDAHGAGVTISEFPTTQTAAETAHSLGIRVLMGAPNVVRGLSHSGNVSARELATTGHLNILASDYVPASMLHGALQLTRNPVGLSLPKAIAAVSLNPALATGLADRGAIKIGARADLCHFIEVGDVPLVRGVWKEGIAVF
ncbi:MAG: alpha-D-ribose 1-methylphosphonate 5-triphosphate diphosphatase [Mesorhizobium sp.]|uniref:alpha-D-ribose 1-methylphosphonate 5-triphosphate diphosphatase n=1 Tax=Mesorhizobium sp. TaxID=1871066 RepID=UPI000FE65725|nr:alpha-D-ribose 1-methylphosphonate 5-triphosphate diphosphatase [Mesorhizobium sp.]RWI63656.1 MAG: alpha-D-ribose 1-methylphosphonate 5-triphosphate diphosphatase [Mesorhizobium sp.]RWJ42699.1 MAG: alpha-D-ribose 1-methylphosphonate 5-triphosphate diphosphatase [Mesorhizobium sp.]RWJ58104.1 MAG: alpha-D-ribose 1-methylphosphonate 5-triphosphate diphosphatase [Mesorhizobium sp.]RWJ63992.1 MAG: alpha-D-ribose 1-methylphosphonate 5-triphosphate diphosphatase [Mesorhizobium sp.]RWJ93868.1 MAG: 